MHRHTRDLGNIFHSYDILDLLVIIIIIVETMNPQVPQCIKLSILSERLVVEVRGGVNWFTDSRSPKETLLKRVLLTVTNDSRT